MNAWPFALLLLVVIIETVLSLRWNWTYFSVGIRVFHRVLPVLDPKATTPYEERLEAALSSSAFPPLAFWTLEDDRFAFREKIRGGLRLGYPPVMRGNLRLQRRGARVEVIGLLNWFVLVFVGCAVFSVTVLRDPVFLLLAVGLIAVIYSIQFSRFSQVARAAAAEWSMSGSRQNPTVAPEKNEPSQSEPESAREILTARLLNARREVVFRAFSDPLHLAKWWGPAGFTNTFDEFDMRPGGFWRFTMHRPGGADVLNESVFVEVTKPERIVFKHISIPQFEVTLTFAEHDAKTQIGWRMLFGTSAECERVRKFAARGNEENLDRLEAELATMA